MNNLSVCRVCKGHGKVYSPVDPYSAALNQAYYEFVCPYCLPVKKEDKKDET